LRKALQSSISSYVDSAYQSELSAGGVYSKDGKLNIVVTGEKNNLKNFWSGKWNSSWAVSIAGQTAKISGDIKV
jgi:capping protein alpha